MVSNRIVIFVNLPLRSLDQLNMQCKLDMIDGTPAPAPVAIVA
jgi:hypothetical protein